MTATILPRLLRGATYASVPGTVVHPITLDPVLVPNVAFKASQFTVEPNRRSRLDRHSAWEIWLIAAGQGELHYDGTLMRVEAGDALCFAPNKTHRILNNGTQQLHIFSIWWEG